MGKFHPFTPFFLLHCFINSFPFLTFSFTLVYIFYCFFIFCHTKNVKYSLLLCIKNRGEIICFFLLFFLASSMYLSVLAWGIRFINYLEKHLLEVFLRVSLLAALLSCLYGLSCFYQPAYHFFSTFSLFTQKSTYHLICK